MPLVFQSRDDEIENVNDPNDVGSISSSDSSMNGSISSHSIDDCDSICENSDDDTSSIENDCNTTSENAAQSLHNAKSHVDSDDNDSINSDGSIAQLPLEISNQPDYRKRHLGHPIYCHKNDNACHSILLFFRRIAPHFPFVRQLVKVIYSIRSLLKDVRHVTDILENGDFNQLRQITTNIRLKGIHFIVDDFPFHEENGIREKYIDALAAQLEIEKDCPSNVCYSCMKLSCAKDLRSIPRKWYDKERIQQLVEYHDEHPNEFSHKLALEQICNYCYDKILKDILPPTCVTWIWVLFQIV